MSGIKMIVCGGRKYANFGAVFDALDEVLEAHSVGLVVHGDATGADRLAREWARRRNIPQKPYPADWNRWGRAAGPIRNQKMLDREKPDLVVAFPGGAGTADMVNRARGAGLKVLEIR
jgi:predicted Rossmann-fold nucleotide-binding protein